MIESRDEFCSRINRVIDNSITGGSLVLDEEQKYLSIPSPNIIEWITRSDYWNVPTTFNHWGQYQHIRDIFNLRCKLCNSQDPRHIRCWGKSRETLESENLMVWSQDHRDFICPSCKNTMTDFIADDIIIPYNDIIFIIGMRSGKSYTGAHIGGYIEHFAITQGISGKGHLQSVLGVEKSEWLESTFAASTATQAQNTIYVKYREMRRNSPWIQRYIKWVKNKEKDQPPNKEPWKYNQITEEISDGYLQVRYNRIASDSSGIAGKTRIFASIDEWSRLIDSDSSSRSAQELNRVLNQSLMTVRAHNSRHNMLSFPFGLMANVTSPLSQDDPAMLHYRRAESGELKKTYYHKCATWEFNPELPREEFDEEYNKDPIGAERDYGANPPNASTPLVNDPIRFWSAIDFNRNPIATFEDEYRSDKSGNNYISSKMINCSLIPKVPHYIFGDAGVSWDSFALVCAHPEWMESDITSEEDRINEDNRIKPIGDGSRINRYGIRKDSPMALGLKTNTAVDNHKLISSKEHPGEILVTVIDFAMRIIPSNDRDIWFQCIIDIIKQLKNRIRIATICFDRWSSDSTIQQIRDMGIMSYNMGLSAENFVTFARMAYNGRVNMLPPAEKDKLSIDDNGSLIIGIPQPEMSGEGVGIVEMMKLNRSPDLRKVFNPNKGKRRGWDSDDVAHCMVGVHQLVQDSIIDRQADTVKKREMRKRQISQSGDSIGGVYKGVKGHW